jgi:hypothetical protein
MRDGVRTGLLLCLLCQISALVVAQSDTLAPYRRAETVNPDAYRQRIPFVDPLAALPPPADEPVRRDTMPKRLRTSMQVAPSLRRLFEAYVEFHANQSAVDGYRIQLYSGTNREAAARVRTEAASYFPDREVFAFYDRPYFKVRIGEFYGRTEADRMLREVRIWYTGAFVVPDRVKPPR